MPNKVERKTWDDFRSCGLLWWINRGLHLFGWAIVLVVDVDDRVTEAYPAHVGFRGFDDLSEEDGFRRLTHHMQESQGRLLEDVQASSSQFSDCYRPDGLRVTDGKILKILGAK